MLDGWISNYRRVYSWICLVLLNYEEPTGRKGQTWCCCKSTRNWKQTKAPFGATNQIFDAYTGPDFPRPKPRPRPASKPEQEPSRNRGLLRLIKHSLAKGRARRQLGQFHAAIDLLRLQLQLCAARHWIAPATSPEANLIQAGSWRSHIACPATWSVSPLHVNHELDH